MLTAAIAATSIEARAAAGAYAASGVRDAAACARLCDDDGLCVAWSFHQDNSCELRATAPAEPGGVAHGLSRRAPGALHQGTSALGPEFIIARSAPTAAAPPAASVEAPPVATPEDDDLSTMLLGGLEEDVNGLRN